VKQQRVPQDQEPVSEVQWLAQIIEKRKAKPGIAEEVVKEIHEYFAGIGFSWEGLRRELSAADPKEGTAGAAKERLNVAVWTLCNIFEKGKDKGQASEDKAGGRGKAKMQEGSAPPPGPPPGKEEQKSRGRRKKKEKSRKFSV